MRTQYFRFLLVPLLTTFIHFNKNFICMYIWSTEDHHCVLKLTAIMSPLIEPLKLGYTVDLDVRKENVNTKIFFSQRPELFLVRSQMGGDHIHVPYSINVGPHIYKFYIPQVYSGLLDPDSEEMNSLRETCVSIPLISTIHLPYSNNWDIVSMTTRRLFYWKQVMNYSKFQQEMISTQSR